LGDYVTRLNGTKQNRKKKTDKDFIAHPTIGSHDSKVDRHSDTQELQYD